MAIEVLIRLYDGTGTRHAGDIVAVKQTPHAGWGAGEGLPNYALIRLNRPTLTDFAAYHVRHYRVPVTETAYDYARSKFRVNLAALPAAARTALFNTGVYEVERLNQITPYVTVNDMVRMSTNG